MRLGFFFDGTSNSRRNAATGQGDSWQSNVDLLQNADRTTGGRAITDHVAGIEREDVYGSVYLRGIGVNADATADLIGPGTGLGNDGVDARSACCTTRRCAVACLSRPRSPTASAARPAGWTRR